MTERDVHKLPAAVAGGGQEIVGRAGGFRRLLGYKTHVWRPEYAEITLVAGETHMNSLGYLHGGVYSTLLDAAFGHAVCFCAVEGHVREAVTISLLTTYMAPARMGLITARGRLVGVEGRIATCEGDVMLPDGTVCARGQGSFFYMAGSENPDGVARRPKWVKT